MKHYQKAILATLLNLSLPHAASAATLNGTLTVNPGITTYDVVMDVDRYQGGSYFTMAPAPKVGGILNGVVLLPGSDGGIKLGQYQNFVLDPDVPHPQGWKGDINGDGIPDGVAGTEYGATPVSGGGTIVQPFQFGGTTLVHVGTNPISYQSGNAHPTPSAEITNCVGSICTLNLQLESWEVMWNGSAFEQGPRPVNSGPFTVATGTFDQSDNSYSVLWASQINGGPFNNVTARWYLEGTLIPVPEPATYSMMAAGLLMLGGAWRLKRRNA